MSFGFDRPDYLWLILLWLPIAGAFAFSPFFLMRRPRRQR